jgi:hypothetical protein
MLPVTTIQGKSPARCPLLAHRRRILGSRNWAAHWGTAAFGVHSHAKLITKSQAVAVRRLRRAAGSNITAASPQRGDRDPGRETCELLLPPPRPADCRTKRFQADIQVMWRQAELLRRDRVKRFLVYLGDFEAALAAREPKGVPHGESFGDRHMVRPGKTISQSVGDPTGPIDEQRRNDRPASRVPQLADDIAQTLRRQLALAFVPLGDGGRGFCRSSAVPAALHLVCDAIGLEGEAVAVGGRREITSTIRPEAHPRRRRRRPPRRRL